MAFIFFLGRNNTPKARKMAVENFKERTRKKKKNK